jgi:hypothetical protein
MTTNRIAAAAALITASLAWPIAGAAQEKPAATRAKDSPRQRSAEAAARPVPQGFSVVLVLGEMQGNGSAEGVPPAARKALGDMKDFLPYKGYRLLDTQWTLCCGTSPTVMRLRGPDEQDYELELIPRATGADAKWYVRFALREPPTGVPGAEVSSTARQPSEVAAQKRAMEDRLRTLRERYSENHPEMQSTRAQIAELEQRTARAAEEKSVAEQRAQRELTTARALSALRSSDRAIIDTSFTMDIGETVVVGTSRLKGDKALIALLTAVPSARTNKR